MTLTSLSFFAFVLITFILYYIVPKRFQWMILLAASTAFYCIICLKYIYFIVFTAITVWIGALWLDRYSKVRKQTLKEHKNEWDQTVRSAFKKRTVTGKRLILTLIIILNFGILGFLKYYNFFAEWLSGIFSFQNAELSLVIPLGMSFYMFQALGYIIDVYWEKIKPEKNLAKFSLFVSFFPQLVQGPIAMYDELAGQLFEGHSLKYENIKQGFQLIIWGLFKKMVIADRLIVVVDTLLPVKNELTNSYSLLALVVYAAQIYMDFSGGIDIARGVAEMLGIKMAENFRRPYFSTSISDFWRRWHITLGRWMRTYIFYPIAVSKAFLALSRAISELKIDKEKEYPSDSLWGGRSFAEHLGKVLPGCIATLITFLVVGMWHGANWKYAGYGLYNGLVILMAMLLEPVFNWTLLKLKINVDSTGWKVFKIIRTFIVVLGAYTFDIADGFIDGIKMIGRCLTPTMGPSPHLGSGVELGLESSDWIVAIIGLVIVLLTSTYQERTGKSVRKSLDKEPLWFQWLLTMGCLVAVVLFGVYGPGSSASEFVYMQF